MVNVIIVDESWSKEILDLANQFNYYAKMHALRMTSYTVDKAFDTASDDKNPKQLDAVKLLHRIGAVNPELISPYVKTLVDAKLGRSYFESKEFVTPNYSTYPSSKQSSANPVEYSVHTQDQESSKKASEEPSSVSEIKVESKETEGSKESKENEQKADSESGLLSWNLAELIQFKILKNLVKINYSEIKSPIKKCATGDGEFDRTDSDLWKCTACGTAYHENCAKITAILEGKCRICEAPLLVGIETSKKESKAEHKDQNKSNEK